MTVTKPWHLFFLLTVLISLAAFASTGESDAVNEPFAGCEELLAKNPGEYESALCFYDVGRKQILSTIAQKHLEAHLKRQPNLPWLHQALANTLFLQKRSDPRIEVHYKTAIRLLQERGRETDAVLVLGPLSRYYMIRDELKLAAAALEEASNLALRSGDLYLQAFTLFHQARYQRASGAGLLSAYTTLRRLEEMFLSGAVDHQRLQLLLYSSLSTIAYDLNRLREARHYREHHLDLALEMGEWRSAANARLNLAALFLEEAEPTERHRTEALRLCEEALEATRQTQAETWETITHHLLGMLKKGEEAQQHLRDCIRIAKENQHQGMISLCRARLARLLVETSPQNAARELGLSMAALRQTPNPWADLYGWEDRLSAANALLPAVEARALQKRILASLETLRASQTVESGRTGLMSAWTGINDLIAGNLLASLTAADQGLVNGREKATPSTLYPPVVELENAFRATEQRRARVLFEKIESKPVMADSAITAAKSELSSLLQDQLLLHFFVASSAPADSFEMLRDLGFAEGEIHELAQDPRSPRSTTVLDRKRKEMEWREEELRRAIDHQAPALPLNDAVPELREVIAALAPNEALLLYQLGWWTDIYSDFGGGSWLLAVTGDGVRVYPLPDAGEIEQAVEMIVRLDQPDRDAPAGLARLYRMLLERALLDLPRTIDHLTIVPDGRLHHLPFDGLRAAAVALPVAHRYRVSVAPSATLWVRWRNMNNRQGAVPALVLADPLTGDAGNFWHRTIGSGLAAMGWQETRRTIGALAAPSPWRDMASYLAPYLNGKRFRGSTGSTSPWLLNAFIFEGDDPTSWLIPAIFPWMVPQSRSLRTALLEPLPGARDEARFIAKILGKKVRVWLGDEASEEALKSYDFAQTTILHLATHALVDPDQPDHLAVVLATDSAQQHGLLTVDEIEELDLDGKVVTLSTCESAVGSLARGEGVLSLARAFFSAGAHTVIASLKPLDDREAALLFAEFYRGLAAGQSVVDAVNQAKRLRYSDGAPFSTWANVVVMGKGDFVPFPNGVTKVGK